MTTMKIVEGLKRLRVIEKRMKSNCAQIQKYASLLSTEKPAFESEKDQKAEVSSLIQANGDLMKEYLDLKKRVEETNLAIKVTFGEKEYSLNDLLIIKRKMAQMMIDTYQALNEIEGNGRMTRGLSSREDKTVQVLRMYDEKDKNKNLGFWQDMRDNIDSKVEVINANTDLI